MKRKYYLRGLGLGILITALVFIFAGPSELSDEEIIKRAEEMGYSKSEDVSPSIGLKELLESETPAPTKTPVPTSEPSISPTATLTPTVAPTPEPTPTASATSTPVPTPTPTEAPVKATPVPEVEIITAVISVEKGNTATVVCNKIEDAGIIEDGNVLRTYLINNRLTDYINVGNYHLSSDMTIEEIVYILTGR